ncbi:MAG TPA: hypothetical protein VK609_20530, partial [Mucilaginibacter sp.]|nr:hypothetical protein [Mucilaginibacter sp.]
MIGFKKNCFIGNRHTSKKNAFGDKGQPSASLKIKARNHIISGFFVFMYIRANQINTVQYCLSKSIHRTRQTGLANTNLPVAPIASYAAYFR